MSWPLFFCGAFCKFFVNTRKIVVFRVTFVVLFGGQERSWNSPDYLCFFKFLVKSAKKLHILACSVPDCRFYLYIKRRKRKIIGKFWMKCRNVSPVAMTADFVLSWG